MSFRLYLMVVFLPLLCWIQKGHALEGKTAQSWSWIDFLQDQSKKKADDQKRQQGESEWILETEKENVLAEKARQEFLKNKKTGINDSQLHRRQYQEDQTFRRKQAEDHEKARLEFLKNQNFKKETLSAQQQLQELGLDSVRPRYDYRRRAAFGAESSRTAKSSLGSTPSWGSGVGRDGGFNPPPPPPPPPFDDFGAPGADFIPPGGPDFGADIAPPPPAIYEGEEPAPPLFDENDGF